MARTERCRKLPKNVVGRYGYLAPKKVVDGHAHRQHYETLIRQRIEKLFGGPCPSWSVFDPKVGTHHEYVTDKKKSYIYDFLTGTYKWDYREIYTQLPGSWRRNPERARWDAIEDKVRTEFVLPVGSWHPYQKGGAGRNKKEWRTRGNRGLRHASKQKLNDFDPDEDLLPEQDEHYNKRDFW